MNKEQKAYKYLAEFLEEEKLTFEEFLRERNEWDFSPYDVIELLRWKYE